jgi:D-galactarolactone cycloisomerase
VISKVEAFPISLTRDLSAATGTAGSPSVLQRGSGKYKWSATVAAVYSERLETTLVRVTDSDGLVGWGEAQAPVAPRVSAAIIEDILAGVLEGESFDGHRATIEQWWNRMYQTMRVRGQTGGFMLDAIAGVDIALWDLASKMHGTPVARLLNKAAGPAVPAYLSGLSGPDLHSRCQYAKSFHDQGFTTFKVFFDRGEAELLETIDGLQAALGPSANIAVDALWRLEWPRSSQFIEDLAKRRVYWLEAPFMPDEPEPHRQLHAAFPELPLALGESYRTRREMSWFLEEGLVRFVQPDLGRSGITESLRIADAGVTVVPHVSIALGPQIAAAIHLCSAVSNAPLCEFNPAVFETANRFLQTPILMENACYALPPAIEFARLPAQD